MTIWYVHRKPDGSIAGAIEAHNDGSNPDPDAFDAVGLNDADNAEIQAYRAMVTAPAPEPTVAEKLAAAGISLPELKQALGLSQQA